MQVDTTYARLRSELEWLDRNVIRRGRDDRSRRVDRAMRARIVRDFPASGRVYLLGTQFCVSIVDEEVVERLRSRGTTVSLGCEWVEIGAGRQGDRGASYSARSYREAMDGPPDAIVILVPFVADRSIARTLLAMAADRHPRVPLHLLAFGAVGAELNALVHEMDIAVGVYPSLHVGRMVQATPSTWERIDPQQRTTTEADLRSTPQIVATRMARETCAIYGVDLAEATG